MGNPPLIVGLLINGVAYAAIFIVVALVIRRFTNAAVWRVFVVVSFSSRPGSTYCLPSGRARHLLGGSRSGGSCDLRGMGLVGLFGSVWWIVAGWALHPLWDVGVHFLGPGRSFAPETYTIACLSFDLLVAAYIAIAYAVGQLRGRTSGRRRVA